MKYLLSGFAALAALVFAPSTCAADPSAAPSAEPPAWRLPAGVRPTRYQVSLSVVPGEATVAGDIAIDVELDRAQDVLWLNADSLKVTRAVTELTDTRATLLTGHEQFLGVAFAPALTAGRHRLTLSFEAEQSQNTTRGVFALKDNGSWYAMTQFEAISARRAFPCFDEPGFKTPWQLTLRVPRDLVALSNTRVLSETSGDDGFKTVRFEETRPLPTYLVAFAVGPWEMVDVGSVGIHPTPTRIVVPRGRFADTGFPASAYPELFAQLEKWFDIPYPFDKLDHIAIPLTVGFAMENAGLITYGAAGFLAKPGAEAPRYRRGAANVGAHEIAHQWFGNLVTTAWWDDIWLNEAFATWIAAKMVDRWRPDYEHGAARIDERAQAIEADALASARQIRQPVNSRGDIYNAFDSITYQKGATVIGMFEGWVGEETFRRGVHNYLEARRDGSATTSEFLASITNESRLPVARAFNTFLNQNGVPQVDVRLQCTAAGAKLVLTQHRLELHGSAQATAQQWEIPLCIRYGKGSASRQACALMTEKSMTLPLKGGCPAYVFANAGGRGYYVPDYRDNLLARLAARHEAMSTAEYTSLLYDLQALVRSGSVKSAQAMSWVALAAAADDRHVVLAAANLAEFAGNTLVADADRPQFSSFVRRVFGPRARVLGFASKPGETDDDQLMRRELLRLVAPEDPELSAEARRLALAWIKDRTTLDPGLVDVVLVTAGRTGDAAMFDALLAEAKATEDRLDRRNLMMALFAFTDPLLAQRGMALLLDPAFDARESWTALNRGHYWNPTRRATSEFIMSNFDALARTVGPDAPGRWPEYASGLCSEIDKSALTAFWSGRVKNYPGAERELAQAVEAIQICARVRSNAGRFGGSG